MDWLGDVVATWFLVAVFVACGAACVARALRLPAERAAWAPIGVGLLLYAGGSTVYNLELSATHGLTFPSRADALLEVLEMAGMSAVLLLPLVFEGTTIALLEIYRRAPQAWTNTHVDRARVLANDIAAALARIVAGPRHARTPQPRPARRA